MERVTFPRKVELDPVTGLPPRKVLDQDIPVLLRSMAVSSLPMCAIMIDIDHFKKFNDTYGHDIGDLVLRHVASTVRSAVRFRGEAYRYGGEEITVLLLNSDINEGFATAERICRLVEDSSVEAEVNGEKQDLSVQISLGVACTAQVSGSELIVSADQALLLAKNNGRNHAEVYDPKTTESYEKSYIDVTYGGITSIRGNTYILLKKWYSFDNPTDITAREIKDLDSGVLYISDDTSIPSRGIVEAEIRGKVKDIEVRSRHTYFKLEVRSDVLDLMFKYIGDSAGYNAAD